ncbi:MAG: pantetheine-phosphate adenylyltransferase [Desulfobacterales bacterium]
MKRLAIYPGSFDPLTNGHLDIVERGLALFDEIIIAILINPKKQSLLSVEERIALLEETFKKYPNVHADSFNGLLVDYAKQKKATAILRGMRAVSDFEYEFQMAIMNRRMNRDIQTIFLMTGFRWIFTSSSIIKEVAGFGGDVSDLVPEPVNRTLRAIYGPVTRK